MVRTTALCLTLFTGLALSAVEKNKAIAQKNNNQTENTAIDADAAVAQMVTAYNAAPEDQKIAMKNQVIPQIIYTQGFAAGLRMAKDVTKECQIKKGTHPKEAIAQEIGKAADEAEQVLAVYMQTLQAIESQEQK